MTMAGARVTALALLLGACGNGSVGNTDALHTPERTSASMAPAAAPSARPAAAASPADMSPRTASGRQDDATFLKSVTRELIGAGAKLDGVAIIDVRAGRTSCDASIVTAAGATPVAWGTIGDLAAADDNRTTTLPLTMNGANHSLTMRSGEEADRVTSSLSLLEMDCQGG